MKIFRSLILATLASLGLFAGVFFAFAPRAIANPAECKDCGSGAAPSKTTINNDTQVNKSDAAAAAAVETQQGQQQTTFTQGGSSINYNVTQGSQGSFSRNNAPGNNVPGVAFRTIVGCIPAEYGTVTENKNFGIDLGYLGGVNLNAPKTILAGGVQGADKEMISSMSNSNRAQAKSLDLVDAALNGSVPQQQLLLATDVYVATQTRCNVPTTVVNQPAAAASATAAAAASSTTEKKEEPKEPKNPPFN